MAMDMTKVLDKYDVSLADVLKPESLQRLVQIHSDLLDTLTAETETQQNREKEIRDKIKAEKPVFPEWKTSLRQAVADLVDSDPDFLVDLVDAIQEIKSDVITMRDFHVSSIARANKPEKVKDSDEIAERKAEAETLRDAIVSVWTMIGKPEDVVKTKKNKAGETVLDLPRIPGGNTSGNVGRGAKVRQMLFEVDGEKIPEGTLFYDVLARYINDFSRGQVLKVQDFWQRVEDKYGEGNRHPEGYDNRWTVNVFGKSVSGWLPEDK